MATFSENQVRQLYVASKVETTDKQTVSAHLGTSTAEGAINVFPGNDADEHIYFEYKTAESGVVRSDLINSLDIVSVTTTSADDMQIKLKKATLTEDNIIEGAHYIIKIVIRNFVGMSDADTYAIIGEYKTKKGDTSKNLYSELADSLNKNMPKCCEPLVKVKANSSTSLTIEEVKQPWTLGKFAQERVNFEVICVPVGKDDVKWGKVEYTDDAGIVSNGRQIADLEWFCMGERADIYRVGYPNNFEYHGLASEDAAYDVVDVVYNYVGNGEDVQKSRKVISIALPTGSAAADLAERIEVSAGLAPKPVPGA